MFVCQCNAITDVTVREKIAEGARNIVEVHKAVGKMPQCGGCLSRNQTEFFGERSPVVDALIEERHVARDAARCSRHR